MIGQCQSVLFVFHRMSYLNNSFDYNVKLLGLLPLHFDFFEDENIGVRFQTVKLRKVKKPSEDHHDGHVIISDAQLLDNTAIVETKIIPHSTPPTEDEKDVSEKQVEPIPSIDHLKATKITNPKEKVNDEDDRGDQDDDVTSLANKVAKKIIFKNVSEEINELVIAYDEINKETYSSEDNDHKTESESDEAAEPVDEIMEEEHSARFLYKSFSNK